MALLAVAVLPLLSWLVEPATGRSAAAWHGRLLPPPPDSTETDTAYQRSRRPESRAQDRYGDPLTNPGSQTPLQLGMPDNVHTNVTLDDSLRYFDITEQAGDVDVRPATRMTYQQYARYQQQQAIRNYWRAKSAGLDGESVTTTKRLIPKIYLSPVFDRIFGGSFVDIRPSGSVTVRAGARFNHNFNPQIPVRQQKVGDFDFDQTIQLNMIGQVGDKLKINFNYDTKANFNFENQVKFDYTGYDTDIIKKVDAGNVSLPLQSSLIQGGQNLFGAKVQAQFGRLGVTAVAATVQGTQDEIRIQNGAQTRQFEIRADQYDRDRHYFLSQYFRDRYDGALKNLPLIQSGFQIRRLEVYVTNTSTLAADNLRNMVAFMDLAEPSKISAGKRPELLISDRGILQNSANKLASLILGPSPAISRNQNNVDDQLAARGYVKNRDFEHVRARKLDPREYKFNPQLGYISLNTQLLPDQVLGVSYEYTYNGKTYKVGELTDDYANVAPEDVIYLKLLKATNPSLTLPTWDLMMKNVYSLNASQVTRDNFQLTVVYKDDETGVNITSLKEGGSKVQDIPLVEVMGLDHVNINNDRPSDGNFDFLSGTTIDPETGKVYFPEVEPFGSYLAQKFAEGGAPAAVQDKYLYQQLYDSTQTSASQFTALSKFFLTGRFQLNSSDEISLPGIRVVPGSVSVYSGGTRLTEGVDYQVFYDLARLKILNPSYLNSAAELKINVEKDAIIQVQPRRLVGTRLDYKVSNDLNLGGTVMHLIENPLINRVNIGDEPTNNTIFGADINLRKDSRVITKYLDKLPFLQTKELSTITFSGEYAQLVPGKSQLRGENGVSYLDDFENSETPYTLGGLNNYAWRLAATPAPIANGRTGREYAFERARLAWYTVDQTYYANTGAKPSNINAEDLKNHYSRGVQRREIFPNRDADLQNGYEYPLDLAFYPTERGPYNYTPLVSSDGVNLTSPVRRSWGGISRGISFDTDFDNANVEYLEFWMLDPFIAGPNGQVEGQNNTTGGDLYLNLGNVSEDVQKNSNRYDFENGLPTDGTDANTDETVFGRTTTLSYLTDAFETGAGARGAQDIGLDGLNDAGEQAYFPSMGAPAIYGSIPDPSADNFLHYFDESYTQDDVKILGRYKKFNNMEGNSAENSVRSAYAFPDKEDLNRDNVINDRESYYEYRIPLKPGDLDVGRGYVVDKVVNDNINGDQVTWYLFRVPIRQPSAKQGDIQGYKNIRFMRLYMTNWQQPVVLRLDQMKFVANQWRKYTDVITDGNTAGCVGCATDAENFTISTVNIEENGAPDPGVTPYVLPPGINRDQDYTTQLNRRLNEQSLQLCVEGLREGYGKAVWKNTTLDMLIYKQLRMFVHAESNDPAHQAQNGDLRLFLRVGSDYSRHYYEYSVPLQITPNGETDPNVIWPAENAIAVALQELVDAKAARNQAGAPLNLPFTTAIPGDVSGRQITVVGNPDLSDVQGLMIGVLNPSQTINTGETKSVCVWVDELRVFDYDKTAGWAATARVNAKLADVATVTATGSYTAYGFGALQSKVAQRSRDNIAQFDVNSNIQADKFLPRQLNLRVPLAVQYGSIVKEPRWDPLDPDTQLDQSLQKFQTPQERTAYRDIVVDRVTTKSINLLNVRKERGQPQGALNPGANAAPALLGPGGTPIAGTPGGKTAAKGPRTPKPWDIENFAFSYAYTERLQTNVTTYRDFTKTYTGGVAYAYSTNPKNFTPFSTVKLFESPYFRFLKEFNFTPLPSSFSVRADLDRRYNEKFLQRRGSPYELPTPAGIEPVFQKSFYFNRIYDMKWSLTKSLNFDYTATNRSVVDEPYGRINNDIDSLRHKNTIIWDNLRRGGRTVNFNQLAALTYRLPLDKFPLTDWVSADVRYASGYTWTAISTALGGAGALRADGSAVEDTLMLGNTIQNNREESVNGKIDLTKLYNKVKFLNAINNPPPKPKEQLDKNGKPIKPDGAAAAKARAEAAKARAAAAAAPPKVGKDGKPLPLDPKELAAAQKDTTKKKPELKLVKGVLRALMTARAINFTFTQTDGTLLPGYLPRTQFLGFSNGFAAPTPEFILGKQYELGSLYEIAESRGWYTSNSQYLNTALSSLTTQNVQARTSLEPFKNFNVQLEARRTKSRAEEVFYRNEIDSLGNSTGQLAPIQPYVTGAFSASFISVQTLFEGVGKSGLSPAFEQFIENRQVIRQKLTQEQGLPVSDTSYGRNSQEVLIPAFLDAYRGRNSAAYKARPFNPFSVIPVPNWRLDYAGLSELALVKRYFSSFTITHSYQSTYNVANYTTSSQYSGEPDGFATLRNEFGQFVPYYLISVATIAERMAPLLGVNFKTKQNITGRVEYKIERNLSLNMNNAQVTGIRIKDYVVGFGYTTNKFRIPFKVNGARRTLKNDLTMRLDFTLRDNETVQHTIVRDNQSGLESSQNQITNGSLQLQLKPTIDYVLNRNLNLQFYFTRIISQPKISTSFKNTVTTAGFQLRYSLSQ